MKLLLITLSLVFITTSYAIADPIIKKNVEYYDVSGSDIPTIHKEMSNKGPKDMNSGRQVWAHTRWRVNWEFKYTEENLSCRIDKVDTKVTINFVVPRWVNRDQGSDFVKNKWDSFYTALKKHEQEHAMHGIKAAREIEAEIPKLPKRRLCSQIEAEARAKALEITKKYSDKDIEYDARTKHGRIEGVVF